jgi:hypothetical protein
MTTLPGSNEILTAKISKSDLADTASRANVEASKARLLRANMTSAALFLAGVTSVTANKSPILGYAACLGSVAIQLYSRSKITARLIDGAADSIITATAAITSPINPFSKS